jgi:hypothetical protein
MKKIIVLLLVGFTALGAVFAQDAAIMRPLAVRDSQTLGFGGPHVAYTDTVYGLFANPAAIRRSNRGSAFELSLSAPQLFDILGPITSGNVDFGDAKTITKLFPTKDGVINFGPGVFLQFPLAIGYVANGLGFGIWDQVNIDTRIHGEFVEIGLSADFITSFGISTSVVELGGHSVDVGIALKPFVRVMTVGATKIKLSDVLGKMSGGFDFETLLDETLDGAGLPLIAGLGVDAGIMYRFKQWAAFGVSFNDIVTRGVKVADLSDALGVTTTGTTADSYYVPFTLNVGASGSVRLSDFFPTLPAFIRDSYLALMVDWRDVLNQHWGSDPDKDFEDADGNAIRNPILNLSVGAEIGLFRFLRLRAGMSEMLPSVGLGLHFGAFQIGSSIYGVELGTEPGQFSTYAVNLTISVRPESKPKTWPWSGPIVNKALNVK